MSTIKSMLLVLTGARENSTEVLQGLKFINGKAKIEGTDSDINGLCNYFSKVFEAFPEGSEELLKRQGYFNKDDNNGKRESEDSGSDTEEVQRNTESGQDGKESAEDGSDIKPTDDKSDPGAERGIPDGDGYEHTRVYPRVTITPERIVEVVMSLDADNDDHWTQAGLPAMAVVESRLGTDEILRTDIENVAPKYDREVARANMKMED